MVSSVVFEDVFMPYVIYCVENNLRDEINKCFNFIEECVCSDDDYQKNVIEVAIIENIHSTISRINYHNFYDKTV